MKKKRKLPGVNKKGLESAVTDSSPKSHSTSNDNIKQKNAPRKRKLPSTVKGWTKYYSSLGLSVIPVPSGTKIPQCKWKVFQERRPTTKELSELFGDYDCNVCIVTGEISGIGVVDLDSDKAVQFAKDHDFFNNTPRVKTSKGYHLYFKFKDGVRNSQGRADLPGIDVRGEGGCAVAPPSIHESGHKYCWDEGRGLDDLPLADFPDMLLAKQPEEKRSISDILKNGSEKGSRNNDTTRLAGHFIAKGFSLEKCLSKILKWNKKKNLPPLPEDEVETTVKSIFEKHKKSGNSDRGPSLTTLLIQRITTPDFTYFTDEIDTPYVHMNTGKHFEILPLESQKVKLFISRICYKHFDTPIKETVVKEVISVLSSKALFDGEKHDLSYRAAIHEGNIWIDLGDEQRRAVKVSTTGWKVVESADVPILFKRYAHMKALPVPVQGGKFKHLKKSIHVKNKDIWILLQVWLVTAFIPNIPRPGLVFHGLHGAGKSVAGLLLRSLIDPSEIALLPTPTNHNEFVQQINSNFLIVLDNLQFLKPWMSDDLCRAVTGGSFSKRKLYTDNDEIIYKFIRLFILNGISNPIGASDILDRSILIELGRIPTDQRKTEAEIMAVFTESAPGILGAIFDVLSITLRTKDDFKMSQLPRMADWAKYAYAAAEALGIGGNRFLKAYENNIQLQHHEVVDNDPVASTVKALAEKSTEISGTPTEIHQKCKRYLGEGEHKANSWPKNASHFSKRLKVASNNLRELGIFVEFAREGERIITIKHKP